MGIEFAQVGRVLPARRALWSLVVLLAVSAVPVGAQTLGSGAIQGTITDESGAAMPGVSVSATSPALQVPQVIVTSSADGSYRFPTLPVGMYDLSYELSGFQKVVRQQTRLNAGFVATINVVLKVGGLEESLTVVGQSPVVDIKTTSGQTNVTTEMLENTPVSRTWNNILAMAAGVRVNSPDVGGNSTGDAPNYSAYGVGGQNTPTIEGLNTREGTSAAGFYYDYSSFEEVQVKALANGADVGTPGTNFVGVVKSGGNQFHGRYFLAGHTEKLQSTNLDDALRANGVTQGNRLVNYYDVSGDLGGRIVRDKLWFYGSLLRQANTRTVIGYSKSAGPDNRYGTPDDEVGYDRNLVPNQTLKISYQPSASNKVIGFMQHNKRATFERDGGRFRPYEATYNYDFAPTAAKGELQSTPRNDILINLVGGYVWYWTNFREQEGMDRAGNPSTRDLTTGYILGPPDRIYRSFRRHWQTHGNVTFYKNGIAGGNHELKVGYNVDLEHRSSGIEPNRASGNYQLIFDNGAPLQIITKDLPNDSSGSKMNNYALYVQDAWSLGRRVTLNLGLRAERYTNWVDEVTKVQGQFGGAGTYPRVDILTWNAVAPRVGVAFDVTGDARTVVKATYGVYNFNPGVDFSVNFNKAGTTNTTYRWADLNGNRDYDPGEVNLSVNGGDFIGQAGPSTLALNPDLKQPKTKEFSTALEREIANNFSMKVAYVHKTLTGDIVTNFNVLRPYSAYDIAITRQDPGPDGATGTADDGGLFTVYDYNAAYRGGAFVRTLAVNRPTDRDDTYRTIEFTAIKRRTKNFDVMFSYGATKNHRWVVPIAQSPNDEINAIDNRWQWQSKLAASFTAPFGIQTGVWWQGLSGPKSQRTYVARSLPQSSTMTVRMEEFGAQSLPDLHTVNMRVGKRFAFSKYRLDLAADLFNLLNANTVTGTTYASGPTYGAITSIFSPRVVRLGSTLSF